jgi:hypothetical protein
VSLGGFLGLAIGRALGLGRLSNLLLFVAGAAILAILMPLVFDRLIVFATAINGAALVMDGVYAIAGVRWLNRSNLFGGNWLSLVIWIAPAGIGVASQYPNIKRWARSD